MTDFKQQYKNPRPGFGDTDHRRYLRAYNYDKARRENRTRNFDKNRNLQGGSAATSPQPAENVSTIKDQRMKKLVKWKEERNRKKKMEAAIKKPAFKVGVVHHSLCSPIIRNDISTVKTPKKTETRPNYVQKRITRATEKRLLAKAAAAKQPVMNSALVSIKNSMRIKTPASNPKKPKSFAPVDYCFKPPSGLQKIPLFGLVPTKQTPQEKYISSQKSTDGATGNFRTSTNSRLSPNKQNSSQQLDELTVCNSDELNTTITIRSSLEEQAKNQTDIQDSSQEETFSSNSLDMKTPPSQKSTPISSEKENCTIEDLIIFSPYLTRSRGKRNSRKEGQQRLGIGRPSDEIPTKDTVMKTLNICVEEEERTAQYFKFLLNKETDRLKELCKKWFDIGLEKDVPEDAIYEIQQAVGQTNLLINKKFERFRSLVQDCETGRGEMLVTCRDLQGFWDMTYMEVMDCDMRFEKLEQRQNREWLEEECPVAKPVVTKPVAKKRVPIKKQTVSSKPSSLRSLILAARKNKMEAGTLNKEDLQDIHINKKPSNRKSFIALEKNTDIQRSARRSKSHDLNESKSTPARRESSSANLVQKIQFSDKSKRMKSPFAAMKISRMCKTPEVQLDDTVSYVNSDQTPGKSILKKSEELENKEARIKSAHKVNFDDKIVLTEVPLDEEMQTKLNLAAALDRIDSFDLDETYQLTSLRTVEKRLDFEVEDSDSADDLNELEFKIPTIGKRNKSSIQNILDDIVHPLNDITSSVSIKESSPNNIEISLKKNSRNRVQRKDTPKKKNIEILISPPTGANRDDEMATAEIISKDMEDLDLGIKVLRNRTIAANNTPKSSRTSTMMTPKQASVSKEENKSSVKSNRKSSLRVSQKDKNKYMTPNKSNTTEMENVTLIDNFAKRRSLRKSVAFDESCIGCTENKPVLPMTPYLSRRSKTPSRQSRSKHAIDEDLILLDTPNKKYSHRRVTRSRSEKNF